MLYYSLSHKTHGLNTHTHIYIVNATPLVSLFVTFIEFILNKTVQIPECRRQGRTATKRCHFSSLIHILTTRETFEQSTENNGQFSTTMQSLTPAILLIRDYERKHIFHTGFWQSVFSQSEFLVPVLMTTILAQRHRSNNKQQNARLLHVSKSLK